MAKRQIAGARVIVTGASSGIGHALVLELARQQARLVFTARREDRLSELRDQVAQLGAVSVFVAGDITDAAHRERVLDTAQHELGGLDVLVNNAGITGIGQFLDNEPERLRQIMEVNFFSAAEMIRAALPLLAEGNKPLIANVSSVLGHRAVPKKSEYCASKFALHGFSDALRAELSPRGIDVLLISPSTTETEIFDVAMGDKSNLPWLSLGAMKATSVARKAVRAIRRGRHEIILTPGGKLLVWFDRLSPPFVNRMVARFG